VLTHQLLYPQGNILWYHWIRGWVGSTVCLDVLKKRSYPCQDLNHNCSCAQPIASHHSSYGIRDPFFSLHYTPILCIIMYEVWSTAKVLRSTQHTFGNCARLSSGSLFTKGLHGPWIEGQSVCHIFLILIIWFPDCVRSKFTHLMTSSREWLWQFT
jgi:hypothetical protein